MRTRNVLAAFAAVFLAAALVGCTGVFGPLTYEFGIRSTVIPTVPATPQPIVTPDPSGNPFAVATVNANIRSGDSTAYPVVGGLFAGEGAAILGISSTGSGWYFVSLPGGLRGFISPQVVTVTGDVSNLQLITPPPLETASVNLAVTDLRLVNGAVNCTDRTSIVFTVTNSGSVASPASVAKLIQHLQPFQQIIVEVTADVPALNPGESNQVGADLFLHASGDGSYLLRAIADVEAKIDETSEDDNFRELPITLSCGVTNVNLHISALGLSTGSVNCADRTSIFFSVQNVGTTASAESVATLEVISPPPTVVTVSVPALQPGEAFHSGADLFLNSLPAGTYQLRATADAYGVVPESSENDNIAESDFTVSCG